MARATHVKAAAKDHPAQGIKKGESYYWWKFKRGGKHYSKTPPKRSLSLLENLGAHIRAGVRMSAANREREIAMNKLSSTEEQLAAHLLLLINEIEWHQKNDDLVLRGMASHWLSQAKKSVWEATAASHWTALRVRTESREGVSTVIGIRETSGVPEWRSA